MSRRNSAPASRPPIPGIASILAAPRAAQRAAATGELEKILFWSILARISGLQLRQLFTFLRSAARAKPGKRWSGSGKYGEGVSGDGPMRPGIKQPGRFEAEKKGSGRIFPTHERTLYEEASHRNRSLGRVRGSHAGASPGGQGSHALASARRFGHQRERVHRCRLFLRQQKHRRRGFLEPGVRFAEQLL